MKLEGGILVYPIKPLLGYLCPRSKYLELSPSSTCDLLYGLFASEEAEMTLSTPVVAIYVGDPLRVPGRSNPAYYGNL